MSGWRLQEAAQLSTFDPINARDVLLCARSTARSAQFPVRVKQPHVIDTDKVYQVRRLYGKMQIRRN